MTIARPRVLPAAGSLSTHNGFSLISDEKLLELYAIMLKCRMLQDRIGEADSPRNGADVPQRLAAVAGVVADLQRRDSLAPSSFGLLPCFVKGFPAAAVLAETRSASRPSYTTFNVVSPRFKFPKQLDRTLAAAEADHIGRDRTVAVLFCNDSDASSKELQGAMRRAGRKKLPVIFVGWNHSGEARLAELARAWGLPDVTVDESDAVAIYRVSTEAIAHARRGSGPTFIDCRPWPVSGRTKLRTVSDPIRNMESYLKQKKLLSRRFKSRVIRDFRLEIEAAAPQPSR